MAVISRAYFSYSVVLADTTDVNANGAAIRSLSGVNWTVLKVAADASTTNADIYANRSGAGAPAGYVANEGTTGVDGAIEFWADPGEYRIVITDPATRIGSKNITWNSVPGWEGGLPAEFIEANGIDDGQIASSGVIANDIADGAVTESKIGSGAVTEDKIGSGAVTAGKIDAGAVTASKLASNIMPLGTVIDWWRASSGVTVPTGWEICDGRNWSVITNDLGLSSGTIPNLIGKVTVGARLTVNSDGSGGAADGTNSTNGDDYTNAPGVGGTGGSNSSKNFDHTHNIAHTHNVSVNSHTHGITEQGAAFTSAAGATGTISEATGTRSTGGYTVPVYGDNITVNAHTHVVAAHSHSGATGSSSPSGSTSSQSTSSSGAASWTSSPGTDVRPAHVGMLKIMKVRNI